MNSDEAQLLRALIAEDADAYAKMGPEDRRRKIDELLTRTRKVTNA